MLGLKTVRLSVARKQDNKTDTHDIELSCVTWNLAYYIPSCFNGHVFMFIDVTGVYCNGIDCYKSVGTFPVYCLLLKFIHQY